MAEKHQAALVKYAVFVGLTPLIPLPFLDDLTQRYFERRLIGRLLREHQASPTDEHIDALAAPPPSPHGAVLGCLLTALLYPIKKLFRKLFFFLEIKRALDLVSTTYSLGYALDHALGEGLYSAGGSRPPAELRQAIERVLSRVGTSPINLAVRGAFLASRGAIRASVERSLLAVPRAHFERLEAEIQAELAARPR
jgi:hypothetical protein